MKSYGVTIQMKPLQQYFHMILFIQYVIVTVESVVEILCCNHPNETCSALLSHEQGWHSGENTCLPPMSSELSRGRSHMWVEFVVDSLLFSKKSFSGYSFFPSTQS